MLIIGVIKNLYIFIIINKKLLKLVKTLKLVKASSLDNLIFILIIKQNG